MKASVRNLSFVGLVLAIAIAFSPTASATSFDWSFTTPNTDSHGSSDVFAFGTLTGTPVGGGWYEALTGNIVLAGATTPVSGLGTLIPGGPGQTTSPSGYFFYDNDVNPAPGSGNPFLDTAGLLFDVNNAEVNIFSGVYGGAPFSGPGTNTYDLYENNGYSENGEFNIFQVTPEPSSMTLFGTGFFLLAAFSYWRGRRGAQQQHLT